MGGEAEKVSLLGWKLSFWSHSYWRTINITDNNFQSYVKPDVSPSFALFVLMNPIY